MTHASTFSGIGGPEIAAAMLGWDNLFHCEINPFGRQILDYYFPNAKSYEDITKTDFSEWRGRVDVLTGGFPCQPFSTAGKRRGAEDDRYLWPFMLRAIEQIRPAWFVGENVGGIATMVLPGSTTQVAADADIFGACDTYETTRQRYVLDEICRNLESIGYDVQPFVVPACAVGAPHRRDRIFIVACDTTDADGSGSGAQKTRGGSLGSWSDGLSEQGKRSETPERLDRLPDVPRNATDAEHNRLQRTIDGRAEGEDDVAQKQGREDGRPFEPASAQADGRGRFPTDSAITRPFRQDLRNGDASVWERVWRNTPGHDSPDVSARWRAFPTVAPICRGNDGLPFSLDDLTISASKWRTESLKAYGNAIVPQVMYTIFSAIEEATNGNEQQPGA